jgi:hypothetical protein
MYRDEIDRLYTDIRLNVKRDTGFNFGNAGRLEMSLREHSAEELGITSSGLAKDTGFFAFGIDTLQVMSLARALTAAQAPGKSPITAAFIYEHPTIEKLYAAIQRGVEVKGYSDFDADNEDDIKAWGAMEDTILMFREELSINDRPVDRGISLAEMVKSHRRPPLDQSDGGTAAWLQVLGSFLVNVGNWGLVNSFRVYQAYYQAELLSTHSASSIAWIGTLQGTLLLIVGAISGLLFDKGYFRLILITAGSGVVFALMMLSLCQQYYSIMLTQGILLGICLGLLYIPSVALIPLYFKRKRGIALGLATAGGPFGGVLYPIVFRRLLNEVGFGWANRVLGFLHTDNTAHIFCTYQSNWTTLFTAAPGTQLIQGAGLYLFHDCWLPALRGLAGTFFPDHDLRTRRACYSSRDIFLHARYSQWSANGWPSCTSHLIGSCWRLNTAVRFCHWHRYRRLLLDSRQKPDRLYHLERCLRLP